jgi:hypothetical protein
MNWVVVDMDGTLASDRERLDLAYSRQWEEFHAQLLWADVIEPTAQLLVAMHGIGYRVLLLTTRPQSLLAETKDWLERKRLDWYVDEIISRPEGNLFPSAVLKLRLLEDRFGSRKGVLESVLFVLEDRTDTVKEMRDYGLTVHQVKKGEY